MFAEGNDDADANKAKLAYARHLERRCSRTQSSSSSCAVLEVLWQPQQEVSSDLGNSSWRHSR
jgi:hypothetical protein